MPKTWKVSIQNAKYNLKSVIFSKKMLSKIAILWTRRMQFRQTSLKNFAWSPKKIGINPTENPRNQLQFWLPCWKLFAENLKKFRQKIELQFEKRFFQRRCFSYTQSCEHVECRSDRLANKSCAKFEKNWHLSNWKPGIQCSPDYVLENFRRKPGKSPSKMRNIFWKVFLFQRRWFPW